MTNDEIKCPKCRKKLESKVCSSHQDDDRCLECYGIGFVVECKDCCWQWNGEKMPEETVCLRG